MPTCQLAATRQFELSIGETNINSSAGSARLPTKLFVNSVWQRRVGSRDATIAINRDSSTLCLLPLAFIQLTDKFEIRLRNMIKACWANETPL